MNILDEIRLIGREQMAVDAATRDGGIDSHDAWILHCVLEVRRQAAWAVARIPRYQVGDRIVHVTRGEAKVTGFAYGETLDSLPIYRIITDNQVRDMWPGETIVGLAEVTSC